MYKVEVHHYRKAWRNGDLEGEMVLVASELFKTRKSAKEYIEKKVNGKPNVTRKYHTGLVPSYVWQYTGDKWQHENSGEMCYEHYMYKLEKVKVK